MNLKERYIKEINPLLQKEFQYKSPMQVPRLEKIVVNMGLGRAVSNNKIIEEGRQELKLITGQAPVVTKAKKSIATFKLREGMPIGIKVDLRGDVMYNFLQKVITIGLPSVRDFRGLSAKSFDSRGNYTFGISEHIVFPEIDYDKVNLIKGMDITIVTTANTDAEALVLIKELGLPINVERGNK